MDKANILVLGSGGFGLSLAVMLNGMGRDVSVWSELSSQLGDSRRDCEKK